MNNIPYSSRLAPKVQSGTAAEAMPRDGRQKKRKAHFKKAGLLILIVCIVVAVFIVLVVPVVAGSATPVEETSAATTRAAQAATVSYTSAEDAAKELGISPAYPTALPEGCDLMAVQVVDGTVLELEYAVNGASVYYRTEKGSEDLTWDDAEYAFTTTEETGGITRSYAGVAEQSFALAFWAQDDYSYALVAPQGMDAGEMRSMAESIG